jgi:hypothetical protein
VGPGHEAPGAIVPNGRNWRVHPRAQQRALETVLDRVGWVSEVLVNRRTGHLVDGHLRVELVLSRGELTVPVSYVDLDEDEEALVLVSLDPLSAMAATDDDKLAALLAEVAVDEADLAAALGLGAGEPAFREYDETAAPRHGAASRRSGWEPDRAAEHYQEIGAIPEDTTPEHQHRIVLAIIERVQATEGGVSEIRVRPEARPFFADLGADAAPDEEEAAQHEAVGCWRPRTGPGLRPTNGAEVFAAYG